MGFTPAVIGADKGSRSLTPYPLPEAIRGGTTVEYGFEGDDLIIKYRESKMIRFGRQQ